MDEASTEIYQIQQHRGNFLLGTEFSAISLFLLPFPFQVIARPVSLAWKRLLGSWHFGPRLSTPYSIWKDPFSKANGLFKYR